MDNHRRMIAITDALTARFWSHVNIQEEDECWEWMRHKDNGGYGVFRICKDGKKMLYKAHRVSWMLRYGEIPEGDGYHGVCVSHHCNNPSCVNPKHLKLGTQKENIQDRVNQGRNGCLRGIPNPKVSGINAGLHKLTDSEVIEMREKWAVGNITQQQLADKYGVSNQTVSQIVNRKMWKYI